ncbi:MAG: type I restriction endonuclease subunit R [Proteobacteria bacterium]|nr:type I restriction endonuclease subunit R [Pseudomonadota bacterium]
MTYTKEADFERDLIQLLTSSYGWESVVLQYPSEEDLLRNWANILFENNRDIDRLNDAPLTDGEMRQLAEQINGLRTPLLLNGFINGRVVSIVRDNPNDMLHFGKAVTLKIYDRDEIAAGQSRYQIARQPRFKARNGILPQRRGDFVLLINGMPVIHVELKKSGVPVSQAICQIEKYAHEGIFTGLFGLVQIFVAMNPEETLYFANPGPDGQFNHNFFFHWANYNNDPINDWKNLAEKLLSIPMAHQMIGFYTVPDHGDGILKVMRSYQYFAANKISDTVQKHDWNSGNQRGGYVWHTTGSGKTLTSFKSAQLIANSKDADKVIFLIDRIELGTQSAQEYRSFAGNADDIQETEDSVVLIDKLKSIDPANTLIVTSIQKMSIIAKDETHLLKKNDLDIISAKRIVFIVDECHRSTFGEMMNAVKKVFKTALFFGFSGTPIQIDNVKKGCTTPDVFGDELHRYSIADGIRDRNVLGFDPYKVMTFEEHDIREAVALNKAKATTIHDIFSDPKKEEIYYHYMNEVPMAGFTDVNGKYTEGIEDYLITNGQYKIEVHQNMVIHDILEKWTMISHNNKFHAILATSSIPEAIEYYRKFKDDAPQLNITALFDPSIDNKDGCTFKEDALVEIIEDYNHLFHQTFSISSYSAMKKDIQNRLAHKEPYQRIEKTPAEQLNLLIVVDQMLTGYDSKWVNVLYLDKILHYENIIQAFSRTNRLFGPDKPFGIIKYYRAPFTMERNIEDAVKLYSGDRPLGMFVSKLDKNLDELNRIFGDIKSIFENADIKNFDQLPKEMSERNKFAKLFKQFNEVLEAAKVQGFVWGETEYIIKKQDSILNVSLDFDEHDYKALAQRYKELYSESTGSSEPDDSVPYDLVGYLTTINTDEIDTEYMNSRFDKYKKVLNSDNPQDIQSAREELHRSFASLSQEDQKYANLFLHDLQTGDVKTDPSKTLRDYISEYSSRAKNDQIHRISMYLGMDESLLRSMMVLNLNEANLNEYGRFEKLKSSVDKQIAKQYFEKIEGCSLSLPKVNIKIDKLLREFILRGGFEV